MRWTRHRKPCCSTLADDRPWPHHPQPPHGGPCREAARPHHHPHRDERPRAAQPRLAVDRHRAVGRVDDGEKGLDEGAGRLGAVVEDEGVVLDACVLEGPRVVRFLVELHHVRHTQALKHVGEEGGRELAGAVLGVIGVHGFAAQVTGAAERDQLAGHDLRLVEVGVARVVVVLVLFNIDFAPEQAAGVGWAGDPPALLAFEKSAPAISEGETKVRGQVCHISKVLK
jgi:hypothetical protein